MPLLTKLIYKGEIFEIESYISESGKNLKGGLVMKKTKSWIEEKLENPKFKKKFLEESYKLSIAEQLIKIRLDAGLTQASLAKKIGTTASAISRYESAYYDCYEINTIRKIVEACGGKLQIHITKEVA